MTYQPSDHEEEEPTEEPAPPPGPTKWSLAFAIDWNTLDVEEAEAEFRHLDEWVTWLKNAFGLPAAVIPPMWHRHDELIWELSALHTAFLNSYSEIASPSAPIAWMKEFAEARYRLRDWVTLSGTRLDRDRATRRTTWPGEPPTPTPTEADIDDRWADFEEFIYEDSLQRLRNQAAVDKPTD